MSNAELWVSLFAGVCLGGGLGFLAAWRLGRKLEYHGVRLRDWEADDWHEQPHRTVARLRDTAR